MTKAERRNPKIIDHARRNRIAQGAGVQGPLISQLVKQFEIMKPLMQGMAGQGVGDRMRMMQQLQASGAMGDPSMRGLQIPKGSTGKRLSTAEREKLRKQREKELRRAKRKNK